MSMEGRIVKVGPGEGERKYFAVKEDVRKRKAGCASLSRYGPAVAFPKQELRGK